jgi:hypothetical protein
MRKSILLILPLIFLSAGCSLFSSTGIAGLTKTVNGGVDWVTVSKLSEGEGNLGAANISRLEFDPKSREIIFAGSFNGGLLKSEDSGESWKKILDKISVYSFAISPSDSNVIYAAGDFGTVGKVLKTTDGGKSWLQKYSEASGTTPVRALALNPLNPGEIIIGTETGNLIRSNDGGDNWQLIKNFENRVTHVYWTNGGVYVLTREKGLYKGSGIADDFVELTAPLHSQSLLNQFSNPGGVSHFNQAYIDPLSSNLLYITTDQGMYKSTDAGQTWQVVKLPVKQKDINARPVVVSRQSSNTVLTAVGSTVYKSTDGGVSFQTQAVPYVGSFVNYILIDPQISQIMYAGGYIIE